MYLTDLDYVQVLNDFFKSFYKPSLLFDNNMRCLLNIDDNIANIQF